MKKTIFSVVAAAAAMTASATAVKTQPQFFFPGDELPVTAPGKESNYMQFLRPETPDAALGRADEMFTVTLELVYDDELFFPAFPTLCNESYTKYGFAMNKKATIKAPVGVYSLITSFTNLAKPDFPSSALVIIDDLNVTSDTTVVVDVNTADQIIKFHQVLPDGSAPKLPMCPDDYYYDVPDDEFDWTGANVNSISTLTLSYSDQIGLFGVSSADMGCYTIGGFRSEYTNCVAVTKVDDRWHFTQTRYSTALNDEDIYMMQSTVTGTSNLDAPANDPQYTKWDYKFINNSPLTNTYGDDGWTYGAAVYTVLDGNPYMARRTYQKDWHPQYYFAAANTSDAAGHQVNYALQITRNEIVLNNGNNMAGIKSQLCYFDADANQLQYTAVGAIISGSPITKPTGQEMIPGNLPFVCSPANQLYPLGASAPYSVASFETDDWDDYFDVELNIAYSGQYGESRDGDFSVTTVYINAEGEDEIICGTGAVNKQLSALAENHKLEKPFSIEYIDDQNVVAGNVRGYNITTLNVGEHDPAVIPFPTVTLLQFRDAEGLVNNRFTKNENASLMISGGTFKLLDPFGSEWSEADLKVEYAPADSEDFTELAMIEEADKFSLPFGQFWYGDLSGINPTSSNGWYAVRVTVSDKAGSSQVQEIYPAFYIDATTGIDTVEAAAASGETEYFNLQGIRVMHPEAGQLLIRRQGGETSKIVVR